MMTTDLSPNACKLLLFLLENGGCVTLPIRRIADLLSMTVKQARSAKESLIKAGLIHSALCTQKGTIQGHYTRALWYNVATTCITDDCIALYHLDKALYKGIVPKEKETEKEKVPPDVSLNNPFLNPLIKEKDKEKEKFLPLTPSQSSGEKKQLTLDRIEQLRNEVETSQIKIEQYCRLLGLDRFSFIRMANEVLDEWLINEDTDITWKHLTNHMRVKMRNQGEPASRQDKRNQWRQQLATQTQIALNKLKQQ